MKRIKTVALLIFITTFSFLSVSKAHAYFAENIEMLSHDLSFVFGEFIEINAQFPADVKINRVQLVFTVTGETISSDVFELSIQPENRVTFDYDFTQSRNYPAFTSIEYIFVVTTQDGQQLETEPQVFLYTDNRFDWQILNTDDQFVIHWYSGDLAFAQSILTAAQNSLIFADQIIQLPNPERVDIFVYASGIDVRRALNIASNAPVAGHASPSDNLILVSIQPGVDQTREIERQIPHEISHIRLYLKTGSNYDQLPNWLREGLASLSELYPNPDYNGALEIAGEQGELLPINLLCAPFPTDNRNAFLAYAQSQSFVHFIYEEYGSIGLNAIIQSYAQGAACANGTIAGTDKSLIQLERGWQVWLFSTPQNTVTEEKTSISAWVFLLVLALIWPTYFLVTRKR